MADRRSNGKNGVWRGKKLLARIATDILGLDTCYPLASLGAQPGMLACAASYKEGWMHCVIDVQKLKESTIPAMVDELGFREQLVKTLTAG